MNRIILIVLVHRLGASYKDFIDDFWMKKLFEFEKAIEEGKFEQVKDGSYITHKVYRDDDISVSVMNNYQSFKSSATIEDHDTCYQTFAKFASYFNPGSGRKNIEFNNHFLQEITNKYLANWVDIEQEYYKAMKDCLEGTNRKYKKEAGKPSRPWNINDLNKEFSTIQKALREYLKTQIVSENDYSKEIIKKITFKFQKDNKNDPYSNGDEQILLLNFSYTNTTILYSIGTESIKTIHIHGELDNPENPIIFGYGDEMDKKSKSIENRNENEYLKNNKSINYLKTRNYQELLGFIDAADYEIFVMGHSCGISDRTLLNTLFEHEHCKSIKPFYYEKDGTDNYNDIVMNIYRNFKDKKLCRARVVPKPDCEPLPQVSKST